MLKGAFIFALGALLGWLPQSVDRAFERRAVERERTMAVSLASTAAELRQSSRKLRYRCPSRARTMQPLIFTPGAPL